MDRRRRAASFECVAWYVFARIPRVHVTPCHHQVPAWRNCRVCPRSQVGPLSNLLTGTASRGSCYSRPLRASIDNITTTLEYYIGIFELCDILLACMAPSSGCVFQLRGGLGIIQVCELLDVQALRWTMRVLLSALANAPVDGDMPRPGPSA